MRRMINPDRPVADADSAGACETTGSIDERTFESEGHIKHSAIGQDNAE